MVKLFRIVDWLDGCKSTNRLAKRTVCLALAQLHREGSDINDLVLRIHSSDVHREKEQINKRFYELIRIGNSWKKIIQLCANISQPSASSYSAVIWLLQNGST